jgi:hypothetical protein
MDPLSSAALFVVIASALLYALNWVIRRAVAAGSAHPSVDLPRLMNTWDLISCCDVAQMTPAREVKHA